MKRFKVLLLGLLISSASLAQGGLEVGLAYGVPVGDARLAVASNFVIELGYLYTVADKIGVGGRLGYSIMSGDDLGVADQVLTAPNQNYLTMAVAGLFEVAGSIWVGADIGYGFGANGFDQNDQEFGIPFDNVNGFYFSPRARYAVTDRLGVEVAYRSILVDDYDASSVTAGVTFVLFN